MNLPITLPAYALSEKIVNQFELFLYMKIFSSGQFKIDRESVQQACEFLDLKCQKTFYKNLNWLIRHKWVTVNSRTSRYHLKRFDWLCFKLNTETHTGVVFEIKDFKTFRPFLYAAIIVWHIRRKNWLDRQSVRIEGHTIKNMPDPKNALPNKYLAKILSLDQSTISLYKQAASAAGYISCHHKYEDTELPENLLYAMKKYHQEDARRFVVRYGTIQLQLSDYIVNQKVKLKNRRIRPP